MNQISPRIFEAAALHTALVLFEGDYSGALQAGRHYFPLRKDMANAGDLIDFLRSDLALTEQARRAYDDLIASGKFGWHVLAAQVKSEVELAWAEALVAPRERTRRRWLAPRWWMTDSPSSRELLTWRRFGIALWLRLPEEIRLSFRPAVLRFERYLNAAMNRRS